MPTSLPLAYSADVIVRYKSSDTSDAVWLIAIWAIVMLTFGAFSNFGGDTGAMDQFQFLAAF